MGVTQQKILRQELDTYQPPRRELQIPRVLVPFDVGDKIAHFADCARQGFVGALEHQQSADAWLVRAASSASPAMTRARVKARCSQVSASLF